MSASKIFHAGLGVVRRPTRDWPFFVRHGAIFFRKSYRVDLLFLSAYGRLARNSARPHRNVKCARGRPQRRHQQCPRTRAVRLRHQLGSSLAYRARGTASCRGHVIIGSIICLRAEISMRGEISSWAFSRAPIWPEAEVAYRSEQALCARNGTSPPVAAWPYQSFGDGGAQAMKHARRPITRKFYPTTPSRIGAPLNRGGGV